MKMEKEHELWTKCAVFHGHECGGLAIGYKAALYALRLLESDFSTDEDIVCISENDCCSVDAIQVLLGCTIGKGNLLFHMTGKMAFSFYNRSNGKSVRLLLKEPPKEMERQEELYYYQGIDPTDIFDKMDVFIPLPERAKIFHSYRCDCCGEKVGENWIRLQGGKKLCLDCFRRYDRFRV